MRTCNLTQHQLRSPYIRYISTAQPVDISCYSSIEFAEIIFGTRYHQVSQDAALLLRELASSRFSQHAHKKDLTVAAAILTVILLFFFLANWQNLYQFQISNSSRHNLLELHT